MPRVLPDVARRTVTLNTGRRSIDIPVDSANRFRRAAVADFKLLRDDGTDALITNGEDSLAGLRFTGSAIRYGSPTWIGSKRWGFWEVMEYGCVTKTIREKRAENADITFNRDHDNRLLFARTSNGTLRLSDSESVLTVDADMGDYSYTVDTVKAINRRDLTGMSFAFDAITYEWSIASDGNDLLTHREIELFDVAVVGMPAYVDTDCEMRFDLLAVARSAGFDTASFDGLARRLADPDPELIAVLRDLSRGLETPAPGRSTQGAELRSDPPAESTGPVVNPLALRMNAQRTQLQGALK